MEGHLLRRKVQELKKDGENLRDLLKMQNKEITNLQQKLSKMEAKLSITSEDEERKR